MPGIRLKTFTITFVNFAVSNLTSIRMASGINIYSELLISRIRIVDINYCPDRFFWATRFLFFLIFSFLCRALDYAC